MLHNIIDGKVIIGKRKTQMTKIARNAQGIAPHLFSETPPPFPLVPNQFWYNSITFVGSLSLQSSPLAVDWSGAVIVFVPQFICITPQIISLSISSFGASLLITVVWMMDLWILDLLLPHSSNISLALVPFSFFPLLILMFAICGWFSCQFPSIFAPLSLCWLMCHFVDWSLSDKLTFPLFLCTLRVPPSGSLGACSWSLTLNECDSCCCQFFSRENFQLAQRHCCQFKW